MLRSDSVCVCFSAHRHSKIFHLIREIINLELWPVKLDYDGFVQAIAKV